MRKLTLIMAAGLLVTAGSVAALASASGERSSARPTLRVIDHRPFTVQGRHFRANERVRVTLYKKQERVRTRRVNASRSGVFIAVLPEAGTDRCDAIFVRAVGTGGSNAQLKLLPRPACHIT
jgi:hypothetical protein